MKVLLLFLTLLSSTAFANDDLIAAVEANNYDRVVNILSDPTVDINYLPEYALSYMSALDTAASKGYLPIIKLLIKNRADVNLMNRYNANAVYYAAQYNQLEALKTLVNAGGKVDFESSNGSSWSALYWAVDVGNNTMVDYLLSIHANPNIPESEEFGKTPIFAAAQSNRTESANALINAGADLKRRTAYGWDKRGPCGECRLPAFYFAIQNGNSEVARLLWKSGADLTTFIDARGTHIRPFDNDYVYGIRDPLDYYKRKMTYRTLNTTTAALERYAEMVKLLIEMGFGK